MGTVVAVRTRLVQLGIAEDHPRVTKYLANAGVTCLEALPERGLAVLLDKLMSLQKEQPEKPVDYADLLIEVNVQCDRLGISRNGPMIGLWLRGAGLGSLTCANEDQLIDLRNFLRDCRPDAYTTPVMRNLAAQDRVIGQIIDILQAVTPNDFRLATLKGQLLSEL